MDGGVKTKVILEGCSSQNGMRKVRSARAFPPSAPTFQKTKRGAPTYVGHPPTPSSYDAGKVARHENHLKTYFASRKPPTEINSAVSQIRRHLFVGKRGAIRNMQSRTTNRPNKYAIGRDTK